MNNAAIKLNQKTAEKEKLERKINGLLNNNGVNSAAAAPKVRP
jgi:hypothetical protein